MLIARWAERMAEGFAVGVLIPEQEPAQALALLNASIALLCLSPQVMCSVGKQASHAHQTYTCHRIAVCTVLPVHPVNKVE